MLMKEPNIPRIHGTEPDIKCQLSLYNLEKI